MIGLGAILLLIFANGFYVAGEFAVVAVDRSRIERMAEDGDRRARSALRALRTLSFQLSGAQLGITISSLLVGFLIEPALGRPLAGLLEVIGLPRGSIVGISVTLALALATAAQMVAGELIPKNLAISKPMELTLAIATPFRLANAALKPLIMFLNASANAAVRLFGIEPREELQAVPSLDELEVLVRSSHEGGGLEQEEFSLLARSIAFSDKTAADAFVPRTAMHSIHQDASVADLGALAVETGRSRFPVYGENLDDIVGIAHVKDLYKVDRRDRATTPVSALMRPPSIIPLQRPLDSLLAEMLAEHGQMVIVVDEHGGTEGILTLEDVIEEIVGEIEDEHDPIAPEPGSVDDLPSGVQVLSGLAHPDEIKEACGFTIPEGNYETLGGFLFDLLGHIPVVGEHATCGDWEFKVVRMDGNRIDQVLVVGTPGEEGPS